MAVLSSASAADMITHAGRGTVGHLVRSGDHRLCIPGYAVGETSVPVAGVGRSGHHGNGDHAPGAAQPMLSSLGTGHSSLGRLAELPVYEMEIDKSFIRNLTTHPTRRAVTDVSLQLGHALGLVVAEGVEDHVEFDYLHRHGCSAIQGYHVSRPLPAADFAIWLSHRAGHPERV